MNPKVSGQYPTSLKNTHTKKEHNKSNKLIASLSVSLSLSLSLRKQYDKALTKSEAKVFFTVYDTSYFVYEEEWEGGGLNEVE